MKKVKKRVSVSIILLLLIGNVYGDVYAESNTSGNTSDISNETSSISDYIDTDALDIIENGDINGSSVTEDIPFDEDQGTQAEKKPIPGFELMATMVTLLSAVVITTRR